MIKLLTQTHSPWDGLLPLHGEAAVSPIQNSSSGRLLHLYLCVSLLGLRQEFKSPVGIYSCC